jgi:hypothetical protein
MGPRAFAASSGLTPWSMAGNCSPTGSCENPIGHGGIKGAAPLYGLPLRVRVGVTLAITIVDS